jgi:hypothetical protein
METKIYSVDDLKNLFLQELLNKTDGKISKVSDHSVLNGMAYGFAKAFQKSMKDVALLESELFPEYAYGEFLDKIAERYGITGRQSNLGSSVCVKLVATPGSLYQAESCSFISSDGFTFSLTEDYEVGDNGWGYVFLKSDSTGANTNVAAGSITKVTGQPSGHIYCVNELPAKGGVDKESDEAFLQRIFQRFNTFSFETLDKMAAVFQTINPFVLEVRKVGTNSYGQTVLSVVTSNGVDLTSDELDQLKDRGIPYLSLQDLFIVNGLSGGLDPIILQNVERVNLDMDFRVQLDSTIDITEFKVACQEAILSYLDFSERSFDSIEWEDLFAIVRTQTGVKMLPEQFFFAGDSNSWNVNSPHVDMPVPATKVARLRMFVVRDISGTVLFDNNSELVPYYYGSGYTNVFDEINNTI